MNTSSREQRVQEAERILDVMKRANESGDDCSVEIGAGISLIRAILSDMREAH